MATLAAPLSAPASASGITEASAPMASSSSRSIPSGSSPSTSSQPSSPMTSTSRPSAPLQQPPPYPFFLGGVAASIAACFTHPLDMVKTRMQNMPSSSSTSSSSSNHGTKPSAAAAKNTKPGMWSVLANTARTDGVRRGLYVGLTASLARQMSYSLVRFGAYDALKASASKGLPKGKQLPAWKMGLCASVSGAVGGVAGNWADVLLVRMTSDVLKPPAERFGYSNALSGLRSMVRKEGVGSMFRGLTPNVARAILMNASQLATYDVFKSMLLGTGWYREGTWLHFSASFMAGTVATTICSPADVVKARVMAASSSSTGIITALRKSFATEGPQFLFRGWTPAWVRLSPNTILIFITLEKLRVLSDWTREQRGLVSRRQWEAAKAAAH